MNILERRRQRAIARTRAPLRESDFIGRMVELGVRPDVARHFWTEFQPYYFEPLTPYPSDHIYGDMKIDPDDISELAVDFEKHFKTKFEKIRIECPDDPTIAELALALQRASRLSNV